MAYSETIYDYKERVRNEADEAKSRIREELKGMKNADPEALEQCLDLIERLRTALYASTAYLTTFMCRDKPGEPDDETVMLAEKTFKSLCRYEYGLLNIHRIYTNDPDVAGKLIDVSADIKPGMVTIDIDIAMPHKKNAGLRSSSMLSYLLDESFRVQIGEVAEENKFERAFVFIEHHADRNTPVDIERDCDNYDVKHLHDIVSQYFLRHGDGPDYARYGEAVIEDDHSFTRIRLVEPGKIAEFMDRDEGFFKWEKVV